MLVGSRQSIATMTVNMEAFINGISRVPLGPGAKKEGCFRRLWLVLVSRDSDVREHIPHT